MGVVSSFDLNAIHRMRPCPTFGCPEDDQGPLWSSSVPGFPRLFLNITDTVKHNIESLCHNLVQNFGIIAFDKIRFVTVAGKQVSQFLVAHPRQNGRVGDLVAVEVQNGKDRSIGDRIQKLVGVPGGGKWSCFRLAIAHNGKGDQVRIIERRAKRMK